MQRPSLACQARDVNWLPWCRWAARTDGATLLRGHDPGRAELVDCLGAEACREGVRYPPGQSRDIRASRCARPGPTASPQGPGTRQEAKNRSAADRCDSGRPWLPHLRRARPGIGLGADGCPDRAVRPEPPDGGPGAARCDLTPARAERPRSSLCARGGLGHGFRRPGGAGFLLQPGRCGEWALGRQPRPGASRQPPDRRRRLPRDRLSADDVTLA